MISKGQELSLMEDILDSKYEKGERFRCVNKTSSKIILHKIGEDNIFSLNLDKEKYFIPYNRILIDKKYQKKSKIYDYKLKEFIAPLNYHKSWEDKDLLEIWKTIEWDDTETMDYEDWAQVVLDLALKFKRFYSTIKNYLYDKNNYIKSGKLREIYYLNSGIDIETGKCYKDGPLNKFGLQIIKLLEENYGDEMKWKEMERMSPLKDYKKHL